jgi:putative ABC transport system substrate-binding protein
MRRREFITLLSGAATWPLAARAQQGERVRRVAGLFLSAGLGNPGFPVLWNELAKLGWIEGRNLRTTFALLLLATSIVSGPMQWNL